MGSNHHVFTQTLYMLESLEFGGYRQGTVKESPLLQVLL